MSILDTFYILFKSNAKDVDKDMADAKKATKEFQQQINDADKPVSMLGQSLLKVAANSVAAFATWEGLKNTASHIQDVNFQLYKTQTLTGINARELAVWDNAIQSITGNQGQFSQFAAGYAKYLQSIGVGTDKLIPNLKDFIKELKTLDETQAALRFSQMSKGTGLGDDFLLAIRSGKLDKAMDDAEGYTRVTKEGTKAVSDFQSAWVTAAKNIEGAFTEMWGVIAPIFTKILDFFNSPVQSTGILAVITAVLAAISAVIPGLQGVAIGLGVASASFATASGVSYYKEKHQPSPKKIDSTTGEYLPPVPDKILGGIANAPAGKALDKNKAMGSIVEPDWNPALAPKIKNQKQNIENKARTNEQPVSAFPLYDNKFIEEAQTNIRAADTSPLNTSPVSSTSNSSAVNIGNVTVNTQATDAQGISKAIKEELQREYRNTISNNDDMVMM
jgi:hypothetical protein